MCLCKYLVILYTSTGQVVSTFDGLGFFVYCACVIEKRVSLKALVEFPAIYLALKYYQREHFVYAMK